LLIVLAVLAVLTGAAFWAFRNLGRWLVVDDTLQEVYNTLPWGKHSALGRIQGRRLASKRSTHTKPFSTGFAEGAENLLPKEQETTTLVYSGLIRVGCELRGEDCPVSNDLGEGWDRHGG